MKKLLIAMAVATAGLFAAAQAQAAVIQLGFVLDRSGSIGSTDWSTIVNGVGDAIESEVPTSSRYEITVVTFSTSATVDVTTVLIDSAATRTMVADAVRGIGYTGGTTNLTAALDLLGSTLAGSSQMVDASYANVATDGDPNSDTNAAAAAANLISGGVDNISVEGIGVSASTASYLQNNICLPGPCDTSAPFDNFPSQGFYIAVNSASDFPAAVANKIQTIVQNTPEPVTLALFGVGLAGIGVASRRRKAA